MILPDSSVWIAHFKRANAALAESLENDQALCHPFIVGDLACGDLPSRTSTITLLQTLPEAPLMQHEEVLILLERHRLMASGIGWSMHICSVRRCSLEQGNGRSIDRWRLRLVS